MKDKESGFIEAHVINFNDGVLKINNPRTVLTCFELFDDTDFGGIDVFRIGKVNLKNNIK
jgi:hypothetical protein